MTNLNNNAKTKDGMRCFKCGETHSEWKAHKDPGARSPDARYILQPFKCKKCGAITEVSVS